MSEFVTILAVAVSLVGFGLGVHFYEVGLNNWRQRHFSKALISAAKANSKLELVQIERIFQGSFKLSRVDSSFYSNFELALRAFYSKVQENDQLTFEMKQMIIALTEKWLDESDRHELLFVGLPTEDRRALTDLYQSIEDAERERAHVNLRVLAQVILNRKKFLEDLERKYKNSNRVAVVGTIATIIFGIASFWPRK
jgi:hypothetical protein